MFCKHKWKVLSETITKCRLETYKKLTNNDLVPKDSETLNHLTSKKFIQTITCEKCGKLKQFITNI